MLFLEKNTGKENGMIIFVVTKKYEINFSKVEIKMEDGERGWRKVKRIGDEGWRKRMEKS